MTAIIIPFPKAGYVAQGGFAAPVMPVHQVIKSDGMPLRVGDRARVRSGGRWMEGVVSEICKVMPTTGQQTYSVLNGLTCVLATAENIETME